MSRQESDAVYCTCLATRKDGFRNDGGWFWVHSPCGKPTRAFLENFVQGEQNVEGTTLNLFRWGPHHNEVWSNHALLYGDPERGNATWITDYVWSRETVRGSESGLLARVWVHKEAHRKILAQEGVQAGQG